MVSVGQNSSEKTTPIKDVTPAASTSLTGSEKAATSAILDFEVDPHQLVFSTEEIKRSSQDADAGASLFPPKNHLLEQLYHARPRTVSTTSGDSPDFFNEPGSASRMGTGYSPRKNQYWLTRQIRGTREILIPSQPIPLFLQAWKDLHI